MGEKDIIKSTLEGLEKSSNMDTKIHFGRVNIKPGKPMTFSTLKINGRQKAIISLPGNPVSAILCFEVFVLGLLSKSGNIYGTFAGEEDLELDVRPELIRVDITPTSTFGQRNFQTVGSQVSSRLKSLVDGNGVAILPGKSDDRKYLKKGDVVQIVEFDF